MDQAIRFAPRPQTPADLPTAKPAASRTPTNPDRSVDAWSDGPVAMLAAELLELDEDDLDETIRSLLDLCQTLHRDEIVILGIDAGVADPSAMDMHFRINMLQDVFLRTSRLMGVYPPLIEVRHRDAHLDLRVCPGLPLPDAA
jgi:hypothetical protein